MIDTLTRYVGILFLFTFIASTAIAQTSNSDNPQNDPRYKNPGTTQIIGILITGGGHFYAGESGTGALLLGSAIAAPLIGAGLSGTSCDTYSCEANLAPLYLGVAVSVGSWIYSIIDSPKAAKRTNTKNGLTFTDNFQISPNVLATNHQ